MSFQVITVYSPHQHQSLHDVEHDIAASEAPLALVATECTHINQTINQSIHQSISSFKNPDVSSFDKEGLQSLLYPWRGLIGGVASGVTKLVVGHPFDTIKVRVQSEGISGRFKGPLDCIKQTVQKEGFHGVYKGATPPLIGWTAIDSVLWSSYVFYLSQMSPANSTDRLPLMTHAIAGGLAGLTTVPIVVPVEQIKSRLQVQYWDKSANAYKGPIDCIRKIVANNGVRGLYAGATSTILFRSQMSVYFVSYEYCRRQANDRFPGMNHTLSIFLAGALSANIFWAVVSPADVIKNKMMSQADVKPRKWDTVGQCARDIWLKEGIKGFWRGMVPSLMRAAPTNGAAFVAAEAVLKALPEPDMRHNLL